MQWYYSKGTTQLGPVSDPELRAKLASGEVSATDMVWREGMANWLPVSIVDELRVMRNTVGTSPYATPMVPGAVPMPPAPTSGLAIASLVCGIMGLVTCLFLPGIPAVICGHMALNRIADPSVRLQGRGMAIAGLIMGYVSLMMIAGFVLLMIIGVASSSIH